MRFIETYTQADVFIAVLLLKLQKKHHWQFIACIPKTLKLFLIDRGSRYKNKFPLLNIIYALNCIVLLVFCSGVAQGVCLHRF